MDAELPTLADVQYRCSTCGEGFGVLKLPILVAWLVLGAALLGLAIVSPLTPYQLLLCQMQFAPAAVLQSLALGGGSLAAFWTGTRAVVTRLQHPLVNRS